MTKEEIKNFLHEISVFEVRKLARSILGITTPAQYRKKELIEKLIASPYIKITSSEAIKRKEEEEVETFLIGCSGQENEYTLEEIEIFAWKVRNYITHRVADIEEVEIPTIQLRINTISNTIASKQDQLKKFMYTIPLNKCPATYINNVKIQKREIENLENNIKSKKSEIQSLLDERDELLNDFYPVFDYKI